MLAEYANYLSRMPLSPHTRRSYLTRIRQYLQWLEGNDGGDKALCDPAERDFAVREYIGWMLLRGSSANTVNIALAALDNFHLYRGTGPTRVRRQPIGKQAPRALEPQDQRRFIKAVSTSSCLRNKAIATIMLNCGLRLSEVAGLDIGDLVLTARKSQIIVRCGKGSKRRIVPMNTEVAAVVQEFLGARIASDPHTPLFLSQKGNRLSTAAIDHLIRKFGMECGIALSSHVLRHTFVSRLVRANHDLVLVAELAGHGIQMTQRYSLPSEAAMISAVETLSSIDHAASTQR